ncbi:MAG TPA: NUDIX hydrolase [Streptosporangiaceae bacterium]|nr:NUDIX hydrolase [Streptosporangiaceae bacterium]HVB46119.1 NUDIX hydrolase [Streptosporangiaceae bacterium]
MTTFRWITEQLPEGMRVRQVYAFCFDQSGRVLLREDDGHYGLPGGKPEPGEDAREVLERESLEESQVTLGDVLYLGYQEVTEDDQAPFAQLRYAAAITSFLPRQPDPDTGRTYRRLITPISKAPALLDWGVDGLLQAADAARAAFRLGVDPAAVREDAWRD